MSRKEKIFMTISIIFILIVTVFNILCCKNFEPVQIKDWPIECNISLNVIKAYYDSKDKSVIPLYMEYCFKKIHRLQCQKEVFGILENGEPKPVDYNDVKKI